MLRRDLEQEIVRASAQLHQRGWVANHDGNISVRLPNQTFLVTPTAVSKGDVDRDMLLVVDEQGKRIAGRTKPFSEMALHLYVYRKRPDVRVVIHAHPPTATGMGVAGVAVEPRMMAEPVVSLGDTIPLVPYAPPKSSGWTMGLSPHIEGADAVVLENHGVLTVGPDVETALLRMELVEHLARIQTTAVLHGGHRTIPQADVQKLLEARRKAGLGPKA